MAVGQILVLADLMHALCVVIASVPGKIRGYGHIKARNAEAAKACGAGLALLRKKDAPASAA
jgi:indolepyruvate ferredoxin oxidoreductase